MLSLTFPEHDLVVIPMRLTSFQFSYFNSKPQRDVPIQVHLLELGFEIYLKTN